MKVDQLNFFQKQYLSIFKNKTAKARADLYHSIVEFVMTQHYSPSITDLVAIFPTRKVSIVKDLLYLEKLGLIVKFKYSNEFHFNPILKPFAFCKDSKLEIESLYTDGNQYERSARLREKVADILYGSRKRNRDFWKESFKAGGFDASDADFAEEDTGSDRSGLPPHFDDTEDSGGLVVV